MGNCCITGHSGAAASYSSENASTAATPHEAVQTRNSPAPVQGSPLSRLPRRTGGNNAQASYPSLDRTYSQAANLIDEVRGHIRQVGGNSEQGQQLEAVRSSLVDLQGMISQANFGGAHFSRRQAAEQLNLLRDEVGRITAPQAAAVQGSESHSSFGSFASLAALQFHSGVGR